MSRLFKPGDTYSGAFTVTSSTGALVAADSTPAVSVYRNGTLDAAVTVTVTAAAAGVYNASATIPGTYAAGDKLSLVVTATVGGVATGAVIERLRLVAFDVTDAAGLGLSRLDVAVSTRSVFAGGAVASVTGAVGSVTGAVTVGTNNDKTGYALSSAGLDQVVVETGLNARQALSVSTAALAGVLAGAAGTSVTIAGAGVSANRITATVDSNGNRTAVTLAPPA